MKPSIWSVEWFSTCSRRGIVIFVLGMWATFCVTMTMVNGHVLVGIILGTVAGVGCAIATLFVRWYGKKYPKREPEYEPPPNPLSMTPRINGVSLYEQAAPTKESQS